MGTYGRTGRKWAIPTDSNDTANTLALRDASGDLACRTLRSTLANESAIPDASCMVFRNNNTAGNWLRYATQAAVRDYVLRNTPYCYGYFTSYSGVAIPMSPTVNLQTNNGGFSVSGSSVTVPEDGVYLINATWVGRPVGTGTLIFQLKYSSGGVVQQDYTYGTDIVHTFNIHTTIERSAGDSFNFYWVGTAPSANLWGSPSNELSIVRVA